MRNPVEFKIQLISDPRQRQVPRGRNHYALRIWQVPLAPGGESAQESKCLPAMSLPGLGTQNVLADQILTVGTQNVQADQNLIWTDQNGLRSQNVQADQILVWADQRHLVQLTSRYAAK